MMCSIVAAQSGLLMYLCGSLSRRGRLLAVHDAEAARPVFDANAVVRALGLLRAPRYDCEGSRP